jgi:hypothetical protein
MSLEAPPDEDEICRFVLRGHLINVYEMLYWPFVDWAINNLPPHDDHSLLANFASKGLQKHVDRIKTNRPGFQHRHHGTFGMIVSCTRSALSLLAAGHAHAMATTNSVEVPYQMPTGWQNAVLEIIQLNAAWEHEAPDLSRMVLILNGLWYQWTQFSQQSGARAGNADARYADETQCAFVADKARPEVSTATPRRGVSQIIHAPLTPPFINGALVHDGTPWRGLPDQCLLRGLQVRSLQNIYVVFFRYSIPICICKFQPTSSCPPSP